MSSVRWTSGCLDRPPDRSRSRHLGAAGQLVVQEVEHGTDRCGALRPRVKHPVDLDDRHRRGLEHANEPPLAQIFIDDPVRQPRRAEGRFANAIAEKVAATAALLTRTST